MPPKNTDDQGENPDKLNFSKTQISVIVGSIAAIVVLALALGFLTRKNEAKLEEQAKVEAPPVEQATELPPPDGSKKEELSKLEENLPKQVPQTPDEELKQKAEAAAVAPATAPAAPVAPAAPQKGASAPAASSATATPPPAAPAPGAIIEKTAPRPAAKIEEKKTEPAKEKKAKREKPKKKRIHDRQRKTVAPLKKQVDVKKINVAPKAEPRKEPKEPKAAAETPAHEAKQAKLENKPSASSYTTEIKPDTVPPAPATVEVPAPPPPAPAAPKAAEAKAVEPKAAEPKVAEPKTAEPKFTILTETVASEADAKSRVTALKQGGYQAHYLKKVTTKNTWYQVLAGAYNTREEAETAAAEFGKKERTSAKVLPYEKP